MDKIDDCYPESHFTHLTKEREDRVNLIIHTILNKEKVSLYLFIQLVK